MQAIFQTVICTDGNEGTSSCENCSRIHSDPSGSVSVLGGTPRSPSGRRWGDGGAVRTVQEQQTCPPGGSVSCCGTWGAGSVLPHGIVPRRSVQVRAAQVVFHCSWCFALKKFGAFDEFEVPLWRAE